MKSYTKKEIMAAAKKKINKAKGRKNPYRNVLTPIGVYKMWQKQGGRCALTNFPLSIEEGTYRGMCKRPTGQNFNEFGFAIDREDSDKAYTYDNVHLVINAVNQMKGSYDQSFFKEMCAAVFATRVGLTTNFSLFDDVKVGYEEQNS